MSIYKPVISASINRKGVLDIDTVKGCRIGLAKYPNGGCYGLCYAAKTAKFYGYDFSESVSRQLNDPNDGQANLFDGPFISTDNDLFNIVNNHKLSWFRVGTMGDPAHNWPLTADLCELLGCIRVPVVVTKHWIRIPNELIDRFKRAGVVFNTSISALDTEQEIKHRLGQFNRLKDAGIRSVLRIVSCEFGPTYTGLRLNGIQKGLFKNKPVIDNPLRIPATDSRVVCGDILVRRIKDLKSVSSISVFNRETYIGVCSDCPDQCGVI